MTETEWWFMNQRNWKAHLASTTWPNIDIVPCLWFPVVPLISHRQTLRDRELRGPARLTKSPVSPLACLLTFWYLGLCVFCSSNATCRRVEAVSDHNTLWWISALTQWNEAQLFDWFLIYFPHQWWKYGLCMQLYWDPWSERACGLILMSGSVSYSGHAFELKLLNSPLPAWSMRTSVI